MKPFSRPFVFNIAEPQSNVISRFNIVCASRSSLHRFFQSLASSSSSRLTVQTSPQSPAYNRQLSSVNKETETGSSGNRKNFFKALRAEKHTCHTEKEVSEEDQKHDEGIRFSLRSLLDFKHSMVEHAEVEQSDPGHKKVDQRCRKRPNYNNRKRAFFSKQPPHHQFLVWVKSLIIFQCQQIFSGFYMCSSRWCCFSGIEEHYCEK